MNVLKSFTLLLLLWIPRIFCILIAFFGALMSLDVFGQGTGFWKTMLALLIHLIPAMAAVAVLILAWNRYWTGVIFFIILAIIYLVGQDDLNPVIYVPLILTAILYLASWVFRRDIRKVQERYRSEQGF